MSRPVVAAVATTPESYGEDVHRAFVLLRRGRAARSLEEAPLLVLGAADGPRLPGGATKSWQLAAVCEELSGTVGLPEDEARVCRHDDPRTAATEAGWSPSVDRHLRGLRSSEVGTGPLAPVDLDLARLTAAWTERPRLDESRAGRPVLLLPSLQWSRSWGVRGAVALAADDLRAGRPWPEREAEAQSVLELMRLHRAQHPDAIALLDATVAGSDDPSGLPRCPNLLLASGDLVALDAVAARLLGLAPRSLPWLRRLEEEGLGPTDLGGIDLRGGGLDHADLRRPSRGARTTPPGSDVWSRWRERGRSLYHTLFWKPWVGRPLQRLYTDTPWGRLDADLRSGERPWK